MRRPGIPLTSAIAWVGVVVGHLVAYLLTYPSQGIRHIHLEITGHEWLGLGFASVLAAIPVILLLAVVRSLPSDAPWTGPGLALRLAAVQIPAFLVIEVVERGWSVQEALVDPAVFVGLALQPVVAVVAARILEVVHRLVRAVVVRLRPAPAPAAKSSRRPALLVAAVRSWLLLPGRRRAPPSPLLA